MWETVQKNWFRKISSQVTTFRRINCHINLTRNLSNVKLDHSKSFSQGKHCCQLPHQYHSLCLVINSSVPKQTAGFLGHNKSVCMYSMSFRAKNILGNGENTITSMFSFSHSIVYTFLWASATFISVFCYCSQFGKSSHFRKTKNLYCRKGLYFFPLYRSRKLGYSYSFGSLRFRGTLN